jgi:hypothetical protein
MIILRDSMIIFILQHSIRFRGCRCFYPSRSLTHLCLFNCGPIMSTSLHLVYSCLDLEPFYLAICSNTIPNIVPQPLSAIPLDSWWWSQFLPDRLIDWSIDRLIDWSIDWFPTVRDHWYRCRHFVSSHLVHYLLFWCRLLATFLSLGRLRIQPRSLCCLKCLFVLVVSSAYAIVSS